MLEYTEIKKVDSLLRQESKVDVPVCCLYFVFAMSHTLFILYS